ERGVRFTLVYLSDYGEWDSHSKLRDLHAQSCGRVDKPIAGLLKDLKRRGLTDHVTVVCCTELGRTPRLEVRPTTPRAPPRPRPPPGGLRRLVRRRGHQGGDRPRRHRRARLPRRRAPPLRHRRPRHAPPPDGPGPPPPRHPRPQAARDRLRPADPRNPRLR